MIEISKMKKILLALSLFTVMSCREEGSTRIALDGSPNLPKELEGLRVYNVATGSGQYVNVAILNNNINSLTYPVGKHRSTTVLVNKQDDKVIPVSSIVMENDSLIICRK